MLAVRCGLLKTKLNLKMDVFPKFIIETDDQEGDCLIVAKCTYHKQLATDISKVKGGGWWSLDRDNSIFTLSGDSHDFGRANIEDIASCVKRKKVFSSASLRQNFTDNFKFKYKDQCGEIFDLETYGSNVEALAKKGNLKDKCSALVQCFIVAQKFNLQRQAPFLPMQC